MNELTISLDPHRKTPLYEQIYGFIREEIRGGRIRAGERLPSARALSGYLSVSRSTVDLAYEQLVSEGYLESVPCKGYFVCEIEGLYRLDEKKEETKEDDAAEQTPFRYDFAVTGTAPGGFPQNIWKKISKEVLLDADDSLFQLGDAKGEHGLREAIRDYLHHARGVNCRTEQIIVGAGNDYLLMLLSLEQEGVGPLLAELQTIDPDSAARLHPGDEKRILRALEVWYETGETITQHDHRTRQQPPRYRAAYIGLSFQDRAQLRRRIDLRVDEMVRQGLLEEVQALLAAGLPPTATAWQAIGYKQFLAAADGRCTVTEAIEEVKLRSRQYAKRQLTWLRRNPDIHWILWGEEPNFPRGLQNATEYLTALGLR